MRGSLKFGKSEKFFYRKTEFLGSWKILQKIVFLRKILGNFLTQEFYTFFKSAQNSASFDTPHAQFQPMNGAKLFFWKLKAQIR
jgi:hypothetical protein